MSIFAAVEAHTGRLHVGGGSFASAVRTTVKVAPDADLRWVRSHFILHGGASFVVIPSLYSVDQED